MFHCYKHPSGHAKKHKYKLQVNFYFLKNVKPVEQII